MGRRDDTGSATGADAPNSPFAALQRLRGSLPAGTPEAAADAKQFPVFDAKVVVARERKGRGGKTVTVVRGVLLDGPALAEFAREMRRALGTGGSVEERTIVLAGDQLGRAAAWLRDKGAPRVVIGN